MSKQKKYDTVSRATERRQQTLTQTYYYGRQTSIASCEIIKGNVCKTKMI